MRKKCPIPRQALERTRFEAVAAIQNGARSAEIAELLGVHHNSVTRWFRRYSKGGLTNLQSTRSSGRPPRIDCERHFPKIVRILSLPATHFGFHSPLWTPKRVQWVLIKKFSTSLNVLAVHRMISAMGLKYQKLKPTLRTAWMKKHWPELTVLIKEQGDAVLFESELSVYWDPNLKRVSSHNNNSLDAKFIPRKAVSVFYTTTSTGRIFFALSNKKIGPREFVQFLERVLEQIPRKNIHMIVQNSFIHRSKTAMKFLSKNSRIKLHYLPENSH